MLFSFKRGATGQPWLRPGGTGTAFDDAAVHRGAPLPLAPPGPWVRVVGAYIRPLSRVWLGEILLLAVGHYINGGRLACAVPLPVEAFAGVFSEGATLTHMGVGVVGWA